MPLTVQQAIEIADRRTERRAANELDLRSEFWMAMSELFLEKRFPWRRMTARFMTSVNQQTYDLSGENLNDFANAVAPNFYEMITAYRIDGPGNIGELQPIFGEDSITGALEAASPSKPSQYFFLQQGANFQMMYLNAPADGVYPIRINFWGSTDPNVDDEEEDIPLLPPQGHFAAPIALERAILRFLYGQEDPRYEVCDKRYMMAIAKLARMRSYTTNISQSWSTSDRAVIAVDATGFQLEDNFLSRSD